MKENLFEYLLRLGDNALILGHRISEWCGHGPILEEDIALINVALDEIGQATAILKYAGEVEGKGRTEDDLAYLRTDREYKNVLLVEQTNGDFGKTLVRQFYMDVYNYYLYQKLERSSDTTLAGIAAKAMKEVTYHLRHSSEWIIRLGDGTEESHRRVQESVNDLWRYTGELFEQDDVEKSLVEAGVIESLDSIKTEWMSKVQEILAIATLEIPKETFMQKGGRNGMHSEHLGFLLAEMQSVPRAFPGNEW